MTSICFFSGKRGGFNHMVPIFEELDRTPDMDHHLVVADMHLASGFGNTVDEVRQHVRDVYCVETLMGSDSKVARAKSVGVGILGMADLLERNRPDWVFLLGDRSEILSMAICAANLNIPIAHLFGGDVTQGGVDEVVRHAVTRFASLHLCSNSESAERIAKMGEEPWRIRNVGSPVLDLIRKKRFTRPDEVRKAYGLDPDRPLVLLLQHSVTWQVEQAQAQIEATLAGLDGLDVQTVAVYPCADPGYSAVVSALEARARGAKDFSVHKNIKFEDFWGLMNVAGAMIGNSSAGVMETASFGLPCVNIGIRQEDRLRADNVLDAPHEAAAIRKALETALYDQSFIQTARACVSPYGDGHSAERIVAALREDVPADKLLQKRLTY